MVNRENKIIYYLEQNEIECIYYENVIQSYPVHTHANHVTFGYLISGKVRIMEDGLESVYRVGEYFCIMNDVPHALESADGEPYSMVAVCVDIRKKEKQSREKCDYLVNLKQKILDDPGELFLVHDMAQSIGISPYHMIRQFKKTCGLTPHQFQLQCRIRKAQKLLEQGKSVTEVAFGTGFCDQSHFDRCFHKVVQLTPSEYKQAVK